MVDFGQEVGIEGFGGGLIILVQVTHCRGVLAKEDILIYISSILVYSFYDRPQPQRFDEWPRATKVDIEA